MLVTMYPTPEMWDAPINGVKVPVRVWRGHTEGGVEIEAYVLSIVPAHEASAGNLKKEIPDFMRPSRDAFTVDLDEDLPNRE